MKSTKKSFLMSLVSLMLCFAMLLGTTYAWFTDEVTSGVNQIKAGNLDVELYHSTSGAVTASDENKVSDTTTLFNITHWEPGVIAYENFMVKNVGNLALKYQLAMNIGDFNTVDGHSLKEVLKVAVVPGGFTGTTRAAAQALTGYTTLDAFSTSSNGALLPEETSDTFGVVIYWQPTDNDNDYNLNNGKTATTTEKFTDNKVLGIELGVKLFATQLEHESDSFGPDYDGSAPMKDTFEKVTETVKETVVENRDTVFTSIATPANEDGKTTKVTVPSTVASFVAESTSSMTVEATPIVAANNTFTVSSSSNGAVGAIDLTVKVNDVVVEQFENESGEAIPVTVETYVAKGLTGVTLEYNNGTGDQPTDVNYDSTTGKLTWKTTHFSTFVLGANEVAYVESNNTAYLTVKGAVTAAKDNGDTITLLKDCGISNNDDTIKTGKSFVFDLNAKTLTLETANVFTYLANTVEVIKNGEIVCTTSNSYIRFEDGCNGTFTDIDFTCPDMSGSFKKVIQTYAKNENSANKYTFNQCEFVNAPLCFEGASGHAYNYQIDVSDCEFSMSGSTSSVECIEVDTYEYGTLKVSNTTFNIAPSSNTAYGIYISSSASSVKENKLNVTLNNVSINGTTTGSAGFYPMSIANETAANCPTVVTQTGTNSFTRNGVKCTMTSNTPVYSVASKNADGTDKMVQNKNSASQLGTYTNSYQYYNVVITLLNEYGESLKLSGQTLIVPTGIEYTGTVTAANDYILIKTDNPDGSTTYASVQAEFNGVKQTLIEALMAQQAAGSGEVKLLCDNLTYPTSSSYSNLKMKEGMTLNLNGHTLKNTPSVVSGYKTVLNGDIYSVETAS